MSEQKFPIILGTVTVVLTGALVWWGLQSGSRYKAAKEQYDKAVRSIDTVNGWKAPKAPPTEENRRGKEKAVADFETSVEELQKSYDKFRAPTLEDTPPTAFSPTLLEATKRVSSKFEQVGTELPPGFYLGFARYVDQAPKQNITGLLGYELGASEELFMKLAESAPARLLNVYRRIMPEEVNKASDLKGQAFRVHSFEVTFSGREGSLREFLSTLDDSEKYYYVVRTMRVKNERETAPSANDAKFEQAAAAAAPAADANPFGGGGFVFPEENSGGDAAAEEEAPAEEAAVPEEPVDSGEILKQVLGSENIRVFLRIDVLQFLEPQTSPKG
ncbi:Amuc_1100 family pilus-like protein [Haloferula sargassicola]|uniref:Uncharacterized protein n=1 Tax=Haloferula sargassicola TaxID=490096 RepID=A0ABP9UIP4_9BACT